MLFLLCQNCQLTLGKPQKADVDWDYASTQPFAGRALLFPKKQSQHYCCMEAEM